MKKNIIYVVVFIGITILLSILFMKVEAIASENYFVIPMVYAYRLGYPLLGALLGMYPKLTSKRKGRLHINIFALVFGIVLLAYSSYLYIPIQQLLPRVIVIENIPINFLRIASGFFIVLAFEKQV